MKLIIKQKYWSFKDNYTVTDDAMSPWFQVGSNWGFFRKIFYIKDMNGNSVFDVKSRWAFFIAKYDFLKNDQSVALFKEGFFHWPFRRRYYLEGEGIGKFKITGSFIGYSWKIINKETKEIIATISKKFLKIADTYNLEILDETIDPAIMLGCALIIDSRHHQSH